MVIKYTNIFHSTARPSNIDPNGHFWYENKTIGNPDVDFLFKFHVIVRVSQVYIGTYISVCVEKQENALRKQLEKNKHFFTHLLEDKMGKIGKPSST
jgi:hypothetical protein